MSGAKDCQHTLEAVELVSIEIRNQIGGGENPPLQILTCYPLNATDIKATPLTLLHVLLTSLVVKEKLMSQLPDLIHVPTACLKSAWPQEQGQVSILNQGQGTTVGKISK